jgi:hypothetical protein
MISASKLVGGVAVVSALLVGTAVAPSGAVAGRGAAAAYSFKVLSGDVTPDYATVHISGSPAAWVPNSVKGKVVPSACTSPNFSFAVVNSTSVTQQMKFTKKLGGAAFGPPIPAGDGLGVCASQKIPKQPVFTLKSDKRAVLTVTIRA